MNEVTKSMGAMPDLGAFFVPIRHARVPARVVGLPSCANAKPHKTIVTFLASTFALGLSVCGIIGGN